MTEVTEHSSSNHEVLSSNPSITITKQNAKKQKIDQRQKRLFSLQISLYKCANLVSLAISEIHINTPVKFHHTQSEWLL
jgi:hypothetical protein